VLDIFLLRAEDFLSSIAKYETSHFIFLVGHFAFMDPDADPMTSVLNPGHIWIQVSEVRLLRRTAETLFTIYSN
jgi:hypothetical protein